jgi:AcrR family transcriptional regulator
VSPRGRRPAGEDTRGLIVRAARAEFGDQGYDRASIRGIARAAGVDARLVHHYFDSKSALFAEVLDVPINPAEVIGALIEGPPEELGQRVVRGFLSIWDDPAFRAPLLVLIRSGLSSEDFTDQVRGFVERDLVGQIVRGHPRTRALPAKERRLRAGLIGTQMLGLALARYVLRLPGVADAPAEVLVARLGNVVQGHLDA